MGIVDKHWKKKAILWSVNTDDLPEKFKSYLIDLIMKDEDHLKKEVIGYIDSLNRLGSLDSEDYANIKQLKEMFDL